MTNASPANPMWARRGHGRTLGWHPQTLQWDLLHPGTYEEHEIGISAIAALVVDDANNHAAISAAMPTANFEGREEYLTEIVRRTAHDASVALGWSGSNGHLPGPNPNTTMGPGVAVHDRLD